MSQWQEEWRPDAERQVREELLLDAVGEAQELQASEDDVEARLGEMARDQGIDVERLRKAYQERGLLGAVGTDLARDRALDFLIESAIVDEIEEPTVT